MADFYERKIVSGEREVARISGVMSLGLLWSVALWSEEKPQSVGIIYSHYKTFSLIVHLTREKLLRSGL